MIKDWLARRIKDANPPCRDCDRMFLRCLHIDCANNGICYGELECQRRRIVLNKNGECMNYTPKTMIIKADAKGEIK